MLHDAEQAKTSERVAWSMTANLATKDPKWAWHEMVETYWAQDQLKIASGHDLRGRKNTKPVLHYTLSWAQSDAPTPEHMKETALASLKALGLDEHQALIVGHTDKEHLHVHLVVNTVHPTTGMTAPLKFTKMQLSRWAEAYEREHGIHCQKRIENNEERQAQQDSRRNPSDLALADKLEPSAILMDAGNEATGRKPYVPVKARIVQRKIWLDKKEIIDRMKAMRKELDVEIKVAKGELWEKQVAERDLLDKQTKDALSQALRAVQEHYRPYWRDIYKLQRREMRNLTRYVREVATYEAKVREYERKHGIKRSPSAKKAMTEAVTPTDPVAELSTEHQQAREVLARQHREDAKLYRDAIMTQHRQQFNELRNQQAAERQTEHEALHERRTDITFNAAKQAILDDREAAQQRPIKRATVQPEKETDNKKDDKEHLPTMEQRLDRPSERTESRDKPEATSERPASRADQIKRDMAAWRARNAGKDQEREM